MKLLVAGGEGPGRCASWEYRGQRCVTTPLRHKPADTAYIGLDECPISGWSNLTRPEELEPRPHDS